jgi:hypothetical protein
MFIRYCFAGVIVLGTAPLVLGQPSAACASSRFAANERSGILAS